MKQEVISFFYEFNCIADKCEDNCCKAWNLLVDEETALKYKNAEGPEGRRLRCSMRRDGSGNHLLRAPFGKCIFQDKNGLCRLQSEDKGDLLPKVCRLFPRYTVSYGGHDLGMIDLACGEAARLFIKQEGRLKFIPAKDKLDIYWSIEEADERFADILSRDLELMADRIWEDGSENFWEIQKEIFAHIYGEHLKLVRNDLESLESVSFDRERILKEHEKELPWIMTERYKDIYRDLPLMPMSFVNEILYREFSDWYLLFYHPGAGKLINRYKKYFGKMREIEADEIFSRKLSDLFEKYDWLENKLKTYFEYKLRIFYLEASVDYYLLEPAAMALLSVSVLILFTITYTEKGEALDKDVFAGLMAENERIISHNVSFRERFMRRVREKLF